MTLLAGLMLVAVNGGFQKPAKELFTFNGMQYVHRYSKDSFNEYTPKSQTDLNKFTDMVTINDYASVKTGEDLAATANKVLTAYQDQKAVVVRTNSVPRTAKKEAEHFIAVLFGRPDFVEAAFARFVMNNGKGLSLVYSHRIYGKKASDEMSKWIGSNGVKIEKALMGLAVPKH